MRHSSSSKLVSQEYREEGTRFINMIMRYLFMTVTHGPLFIRARGSYLTTTKGNDFYTLVKI
jgi:hypothetical protein